MCASQPLTANSPGVVPPRKLVGTFVYINEKGIKETMKGIYKLYSLFRGLRDLFAGLDDRF